MSNRRGGLGRGLGALIPGASVGGDQPVPGARFQELPVDAVEPNPRQPRQDFDERAMAELEASVRAVGVLQPVVVREAEPGRYQLVMGERRWRAARAVGLAALPAIIRDTADDALLRDAVLENVHRQQLNPLEEAAAYQQLLSDFGLTHEELAERLGRSRAHVSNTIRLLGLPPAVQRRVAAGVLSAGHARALLAVADPQLQEELAARIVAEGWSVRATEEAVAAGQPARRHRTRGTRAPDPAMAALARSLSDAWDTRVRVDVGRRKGRIVVEFAGPDDLDRILTAIAPQLPRPDARYIPVDPNSSGSPPA